MLTVLLPVTRAWTRNQVIAAIEASDIPRERAVLVFDAPDCDAFGWWEDFARLGFSTNAIFTGNDTPPAGRLERRDRHRTMRAFTQRLVPDGPLLCLEDDTIVPPDVYARLSAAGENASGVQVGRHSSRNVGIRGYSSRSGVTDITACGHYCLLTTGSAYKAALVPSDGQVDTGHTSQIRPLVVDWDCICGHLTPEGVLYP